MKRAASPFILLLGILLILIFEPAEVQGQNKDLRVKVIKDGKETAIYQKLITNKTTKVRELPRKEAKQKLVQAYNIFYRLKTDSGQAKEGGYYRIGDSDGSHLGWVLPEDVVEWNTRFVIKPKMVSEKITFSVDSDGDGAPDFAWNESDAPSDATAFSFITGNSTSSELDAEDVGPFPICFCISRIQDQGTLDNLNDIGDSKLEIVFVIEGASYLDTEYDGAKPFIDVLNDLAQAYIKLVESENTVDIPVRFGLVGFQDASSNYQYLVPKVLQPLTDDLEQWKSKVAAIKYPEQNMDLMTDVPNDGASAVFKALSKELDWTENSSKHIVLIGHNPFQTYGKMSGGKPPVKGPLDFLWDRGSSIYSDADWSDRFGYNTSGKSVNDLLSLTSPTAGTVGNQIRLQTNIHTLHVGQTTVQLFGQELMGNVEKINDTVKEVQNEFGELALLRAIIDFRTSNPSLYTAIIFSEKLAQLNAYDAIAESNYRTLGQDGYSTHMDPTLEDVARATRELQDQVGEAIKVITDVAIGNANETQSKRKSNEFTKPLFKMISTSMKKGEIINRPVREGIAYLRDENTGRKVGEKLIMVSREELTRLKGTFNSLYEQFNQKRKRADRQDVNEILNDLKQSLASAATGQKLDSNVNLAELITSLPLRTEALRLNAGDIAVMSTDGFERWLNELNTAVERLDNLLTGDQSRWISISSLGNSAKQFGFLRLSELP